MVLFMSTFKNMQSKANIVLSNISMNRNAIQIQEQDQLWEEKKRDGWALVVYEKMYLFIKE